MLQLALEDGLKLLGVVGRVQLRVVQRCLADDGIEEMPTRWHPAAGRHGTVVAGPLEQVAVGLVLGVEILRHQHGRAVGKLPFLELRLRKAEHGPGAVEADRIDAQRGLQIGGDLPEHLVDLDHLDRRAGLVQPEGLPKFIDHADVDAGLEAAAEIHRELVRLPVGAGGEDAFA